MIPNMKDNTSVVLHLNSRIAEKLRQNRSGRDPTTFITFKNGIVTKIEEDERKMKSLIEEFALMTGKETANLLQNTNISKLYRCSKFMSSSPLSLNFNVYSWVTSPMRRFSDISSLYFKNDI
jgi:exoribonuclease R